MVSGAHPTSSERFIVPGKAETIHRFRVSLVLFSSLLAPSLSFADDIPHGQSRPPGAPLSPVEAIKKMVVPKGFQVELVASEPNIVNPVAMTFDERGRIWITESLEYPRREPGPGRDRVKILEDTDGDGTADKFTTFAEGLNIPSGIAVGHGGVWVANSPDILLLKDTDGDGKADLREVVVTGFGRDDTHELPNSLTWGPDGWLYGWNGVFNRSVVKHRGKTFNFTCAIFRIHPKTRDFELFCEGTSNPWGIAFDTEGSAFASACVIDHLWHLTESGYYHRQGGPYPPNTWKIESIVKHNHQKAAYCGIHYYDSDVYPAEYRNVLYMGNIHGNCINADILERDGSTYIGKPRPDFLSANDAWFMPVVQKTGPDGCLYILDWYDRYHCYQDANRDPAGIDRLKGRLYRVRYGDAPRRWGFDLGAKSVDELIALLGSGKSFDRETALRLLVERSNDAVLEKLELIDQNPRTPRPARLNAIWAMLSSGPLDFRTHYSLLADEDPTIRAWAVRAAGNTHKTYPKIRDRIIALAHDSSPDVQLQVAIAAPKIEEIDEIELLVEIASSCGEDRLIPRIVWQNLKPSIDGNAAAARFASLVTPARLRKAPGLVALIPHAVNAVLGQAQRDSPTVVELVKALRETNSEASIAAARESLEIVADRYMTGGISAADGVQLGLFFEPMLKSILDTKDDPLKVPAAILAAAWKDPGGLAAASGLFRTTDLGNDERIDALDALIHARDASALDAVADTIANPNSGSADFRGRVIASLGKLDDNRVATILLTAYPRLEPALRPRAVELLIQRSTWRKALIDAVAENKIARTALNSNQVRRLLLTTRDPALTNQINTLFGTVRESRNPQREQVIAQTRSLLRKTPGDPRVGSEIFKRVCGQCHKIYGEGQELGPDITLNGRASYEQLLSNVLDPSLVIGAAYQATTVATTDGRVLTGLAVEESPRMVVLKLQGGKLESIPRQEIDQLKVSDLSMMPEDLEKQLKPQELIDLFSFLTLDRPPTDQNAKPLPGAEEIPRR
jgi:putative membrane-bound dehydrogenase-like protein